MARGDQVLVERIERIYEQRYAAFCRMATGITGQADAARDAVQEGFARALARRHEFREEGPLDGWLWRIVFRAALDSRRRAAPAPVSLDGAEAQLWTPRLPHPERDPELDAALRALPPRQRLAVFLRYFGELSHAEIAAVTGMRPGTVSATLNQAKATLARRLERVGIAGKEQKR